MSHDRVVLSLLKTKKIPYYVNGTIAIFQCLNCSSQATIVLTTSSWQCEHCGDSGNLTNLIATKQISVSSRPFFNPIKHFEKIKKILNRTAKKSPDVEQELQIVVSLINELVQFHIQTFKNSLSQK